MPSGTGCGGKVKWACMPELSGLDPKLADDLFVDSADLNAYRIYAQTNHGIDNR